MSTKLRKHYSKTEKPFVYPDGVILQPQAKLSLFKQPSWGAEWADRYSRACRYRFLTCYHVLDDISLPEQSMGSKRKHSEVDDDYELFLQNQGEDVPRNEYDQYISSPKPLERIDSLQWWKQHAATYPCLNRMA